jgi:hypothetical protein
MKKISLRKPTRGRGKLINLPDEKRELLISWMMSDTPYAEILDRVRNQFGLPFKSTVPLERFWRKVCRPILLQRRTDELRAASTARKDIKKALENPEANVAELKEILRQFVANDERPPSKPGDPAHPKEMATDETNPLDDQEKLDEIRRQVFGSAPQS